MADIKWRIGKRSKTEMMVVSTVLAFISDKMDITKDREGKEIITRVQEEE